CRKMFVSVFHESKCIFSILIRSGTYISSMFSLSLHDALPILLVFNNKDFEINNHLPRYVSGIIAIGKFQMDDVQILFNISDNIRSEEHTSELQSRENIVCRLMHEKRNT